MAKNSWLLFIALALIAGLGVGYWYGKSGLPKAFSDGYQQALTDAAATQEAAAKRAAEEAAQAANPFKVENPLEGVTANPFEKAKQILNPF